MNPASSLPAPASALVLKLDTLGDLVLFSPALRALRRAWPDTDLRVVIRETYLDTAPLLAPGVTWVTTPINPFAQGPDQAAAETAALQAALTGFRPEVIAAATSRGNWLQDLLASQAEPPATGKRRTGALSGGADPFFAMQLEARHGVPAHGVFDQVLSPPADEPDWRRNFRLVGWCLGQPVPPERPTLAAPAEALASVRRWRQEQGLAGRYAVVAAAGYANVRIKTWPADKFAAVVRHLRTRHGLEIVLAGHESEAEQLQAVAQAAGAPTRTWLGGAGGVPGLTALIAEAALLVGNDTGALHLAAALDVPVAGIYGGGTWPRFAPASGRAVAVVEPVPCFGCGWDCAFGDAPCVRDLPAEAVQAAVDQLVAEAPPAAGEPRMWRVESRTASERGLMAAAAARHQALQADHRARQLKIEEKERGLVQQEAEMRRKEQAIHEKHAALLEREASNQEKEGEIARLKVVCDEREALLKTVHGHAHALTDQLNVLRSEHSLLQSTLARLPTDAAASAQALQDQAVHIRNLEALGVIRERELTELRATVENHREGRHTLEAAKHFGRLLAEKEAVLQALAQAVREREAVIARITLEPPGQTSRLRRLAIAARAHVELRWRQPLAAWISRQVLDRHWMQIGILRQYEPRPLRWEERLPYAGATPRPRPRIGLVTPSYGQERFLERTMASVLGQSYPDLHYVVQDGGSKDGSPALIARHAARLHHWESAPDRGQADAIARGFRHLESTLGPDDVMAWLNSDDLIGPGVLGLVGDFFARHPEVDLVYGHRIIIDEQDREVARWVMPRHDPAVLEWIDYVPQETMFWRKRIWDRVGGIDPSFQFALDWDLLARFQQAGARVVRLPYFLGAFRVHPEQKTSAAIHTTGAEEMRRIRTRFHGDRHDDFATIQRHAQRTRLRGACVSRLLELGIRW